MQQSTVSTSASATEWTTVNRNESLCDTLQKLYVYQNLLLIYLDLASTAGYRTISDLFGVSVSFVCNCIEEVCEAIRRHFSNAIKFPKGAEILQVRDILSGNKNPPPDKMSSKLKVLPDKTDF